MPMEEIKELKNILEIIFQKNPTINRKLIHIKNLKSKLQFITDLVSVKNDTEIKSKIKQLFLEEDDGFEKYAYGALVGTYCKQCPFVYRLFLLKSFGDTFEEYIFKFESYDSLLQKILNIFYLKRHENLRVDQLEIENMIRDFELPVKVLLEKYKLKLFEYNWDLDNIASFNASQIKLHIHSCLCDFTKFQDNQKIYELVRKIKDCGFGDESILNETVNSILRIYILKKDFKEFVNFYLQFKASSNDLYDSFYDFIVEYKKNGVFDLTKFILKCENQEKNEIANISIEEIRIMYNI